MDDPARFRFGPFELDLGTFKLLRDGTPLPTEPKAVDLLRVLLERAPRVVEKAEIFSLVWKDVAVTDNALTRLVAQLRKVLDDDPKAPRYIETVATRGYRFVAVVTVVPPAVGTPREPVQPSLATHVDQATQRSQPFGVRQLVSAALIVAVILSAFAWVASRFLRSAPSREAWLTSAGLPDVLKLAALRPEQMTTGQGYDGFLAFAPDGHTIAYSSDRSGALEIYVQGVAPGSSATALTSNGQQNVQPAWSPDGQFLAFHEMARGGIWIVPSRGGVPRRISDFGSHPVWSSDGRRLAFQSLPTLDINGVGVPGALSTIWIVDVKGTGAPVAVTKPGAPAGPHLTPAWSSDSKRLFFAATPSLSAGGVTSLWSVDLEGGQLRQIVAHPRLTPEYVVAPNGRAIYFAARGTNTIWWMPFDDSGAAAEEPRPTGLAAIGSSIAHLAISADQRHVGWTSLEVSNHVWASPAENNRVSETAVAGPLTQGLGVRYGLPAPASDGRLALMGNRAGSNTNIFLLAPRAPMRQLTTEPKNHGGPQWLPGEREIAFITEDKEKGTPGYRAIDPETGRQRDLFSLSDLPRPSGESQPSTAAPSVNIAFAPDFSQLVMAIVRDGRPNLWVAGLRHFRPDGRITQRTFEREGGSYPSWSPDGRWIAYQCTEGIDTHVCITGGEHGERIQLTHEPGQSWVGGWAVDNDRVLFAAKRAAVWNVATVSRSTSVVRTLTSFTEPRGYVRYPRWDPAHNRAVFERSETTGRIWSVELP